MLVLRKRFLKFGDDIIRTVIVEITLYSNVGLTHCFVDLQNCLWAWFPLLVDQHSHAIFCWQSSLKYPQSVF